MIRRLRRRGGGDQRRRRRWFLESVALGALVFGDLTMVNVDSGRPRRKRMAAFATRRRRCVVF